MVAPTNFRASNGAGIEFDIAVLYVSSIFVAYKFGVGSSGRGCLFRISIGSQCPTPTNGDYETMLCNYALFA